jgi:HSP20 family protein
LTLDTVEVTRMMFDPFAPLLPRAGAFLAPVDVRVGERDMVLTFDLPGLKADDIDIQVLDRELVLRGERKRLEAGDAGQWMLAERPFGAFERRIHLPEGVDADAITANMEAGVLSLIVPKPERLNPKSIRIGGAEQRELETSTA